MWQRLSPTESKQLESRIWWSLPGSGVEAGGALGEGAIREVKEETGLDIRLTGLI